MTDQASEAVRNLREVLDGVSRSLVGFDLDALLAAGPDLQTALEAIQRVLPTCAKPGAELAAHIDAARQALRRCERLGASLGDLTRIATAAHGSLRGLGYDHTGRERESALRPTVEVSA